MRLSKLTQVRMDSFWSSKTQQAQAPAAGATDLSSSESDISSKSPIDQQQPQIYLEIEESHDEEEEMTKDDDDTRPLVERPDKNKGWSPHKTYKGRRMIMTAGPIAIGILIFGKSFSIVVSRDLLRIQDSSRIQL